MPGTSGEDDLDWLTPSIASFVHPPDGATDVDLTVPFSWSEVPGAQGYHLTIGTEPGARDLFDSALLPPSVRSRDVVDLPVLRTVYARIGALQADGWRYEDIAFSVSRARDAQLHRPAPGAVLPDEQGFRFAWSAVSGAERYRLQIGTCRGCSNAGDSGPVSGTEWSIRSLPSGVALHARLHTRRGSSWTYRDSAFAAGTPLPPAVIARPFDGQTDFAATTPFSWREVPTATAYRLQIGTAPGRGDVHDSGPIRVNRRLVAGLPVGVPLFGSLATESDGVWRTTSFSFSVRSAAVTARAQILLAEWYAVRTRRMADQRHRVLQESPLHGQVRRFGRTQANCWDYAVTLVGLLNQAGVDLDQRTLTVAFNPNGYEVHSPVELLDPTTQRWFILDPTFMVTMEGAWDGSRLGAEEISTRVRQYQFDEIRYRFLVPAGDGLIRTYYMDYPLLYLNVVRAQPVDAPPVTPYMTERSLPLSGPPTSYVFQCTQGATGLVRLDGADTTVTCDGVESTSRAYIVRTIEPVGDPSNVRVFELNWYQF